MFEKILIANRGEIAIRIMRTCENLGISTIVIYSEADKDSLHVKLADKAYLVGGSRVADSYLNMEKIFEVAQICDVDAIHPGYGLLSENAEFAKKCEEKGFVFIGPSPSIISAMGDKIKARSIMKKAGVPVVPGISHPLSSVDEAIIEAENIGYPIMLKASSGGGGIGMQVVRSRNEMQKAYESNQKRAISFFGHSEMYLEKYLENPRHIEIQLLTDHEGNTVFLWERECSIQRRHQKIVEEAPSSFIDEQTRLRMGEIAILAAKEIGYTNAGTIEFLVDQDKNFYFLEMNTRIQVEHPVTEEITGIDIVEQQIKIAQGHTLPFTQKQINRSGHAIEVRIYAEDPKTHFPSPGTITKLSLPHDDGVRHEIGVHSQSTVTHFYDPMIAKLIVKGKNRQDAIERLAKTLDSYDIEGIKTNIPMLKKIVKHQAFLNGDTTTEFVKNYL
ncbi:acetyl-CoA carboxylase biotin carboxylase subunit [Metabacillus crassostreae]|uniref:acetyl-CoA carboxylase biotin carboxylase subunit n=1 Tax=Metabacillus crassostreae TaxID=929098 RepID=UPI00195C4554|nr:acetyl-CoA carboxylase biotin carboxylase subunit [Metabacillus crassostreae]MBM7602289.1 acetyl-CoA carboxylase biotin carboxylase subunit [Metabacillus crassostreae]